MVPIVAAASRPLISLVFSAEYAAAAPAATILALGATMLAFAGTGQTLLVAANRPVLAFVGVSAVLPVSVALNLVLVPRYELVGAATATTVAGTIAASILVWAVWTQLRVLPGGRTILRVVLAAAATYAAGRLLDLNGPLVLAQCSGMAVGYVGLLFALRELGRDDLALLGMRRGEK
jgi:O-antigen/teichoic acid export membrane protein